MKKYFVLCIVFLLAIYCGVLLGEQLQKNQIVNDVKALKNTDYNVIIISLSNVIGNHLGSYGYFRDTSPNIDQFNTEATVFKNAFTVSSWTSPAAATMLTSLYPYTHNLMRWHRDVKPLNAAIPTIAEILQKKGYRTASFNGGADYDKVYGFDRGFETYFQGEPFSGLKELTPAVLNWLKVNKDQKFFLHLQSFDVHAPYNPPEPFRSKYDALYINKNNISFNASFYNATEQKPQMIKGEKYYAAFSSFPPRMKKEFDDQGPAYGEVLLSERDIEHLKNLYDADISYTDFLLGTFLKKLDEWGLYKNTIVIFTSEHGELLFKNGRIMRGGIMRGNAYEDVVHIPLSIRIPGNHKKKIVKSLASIVDIVPTILDLLKIEYSSYHFQGKSLVPIIKEDKEVNPYVFSGTKFYGDKYNRSGSKFFFGSIRSELDMIRSHKWKLIREKFIKEVSRDGRQKKNNHSPKVSYELYDLEKDPYEESNVYNKYPEIRNRLIQDLEVWRSSLESYQSSMSTSLSDTLLNEMQSRGYW